MSFRFNQGDRPLPGYTIERGVGRGGFGEVYYARSDGGKEVALKYLRENPQIELRGATHCLNLKSPHLVDLHDIKQSEAGDFFVIMEYVHGPTLRDLMNEEPGGLGAQKAAYFLREIAKGLAYLHDRGIVHRDLKPGNIFYEDGYVKIGDYGLSKIMAASQHSGQTMSVGTVHYMAPEVGSGNYDRTIDIYALGVVLYEMLLGRVPFSGASMGEVLMKHLTTQPEVDELPQPFPNVIRKALAKDPKDRYPSVNEMMADVFAVEHLNRSVAAFEPASLSRAAAGAAAKVHVPAGGGPRGFGVGTGSSNVGQAAPPPVVNPALVMGSPAGRFGRAHDRIAHRVDAVADRIDQTRLGRQVAETAGRRGGLVEKIVLGLVVCGGMSVGATVLAGGGADLAVLVFSVCVTFVGSVLLGHWLCVERFKQHGAWTPRFIVAAIMAVTLAALRAILVGGVPSGAVVHDIGGSWLVPVLLAALVCDWRSRLDRGRRGEVSVGAAFYAGLFGFVCAAVFANEVALPVAAMLAAASLCIQTVGGIWPLTTGAEGASPSRDGSAGGDVTYGRDRGAFSRMPGDPVVVSRDGMPVGAVDQAARVGAAAVAPRLLRDGWVRATWAIVAVVLLLSMVLAFASTAVVNTRGDDFGIAIMNGTILAHAFLFAVWCAVPRYKKGLWRGVFRKAVFLGGLALAACCGEAMGLMGCDLGKEFLFTLTGILIGGLSAIAVWFIPVPAYVPAADKPAETLIVEAENRRRLARRLRISGLACVGMMVTLTPVLMLIVPERDWDDVLPGLLIPLAPISVGLIAGSIVLRAKRPTKPDTVDLPLRRSFVVDSIDRVDELLMRHTALHGYHLKHRGDLFWVFRRGGWVAQFWQSDIRRWRTDLRIAAYTHAHDGHLLSCHLDIEHTFQQPPQPKLRTLSAEMDELRDLLGGRDASAGGREVSA